LKVTIGSDSPEKKKKIRIKVVTVGFIGVKQLKVIKLRIKKLLILKSMK
jgi:hypothetical protein